MRFAVLLVVVCLASACAVQLSTLRRLQRDVASLDQPAANPQKQAAKEPAKDAAQSPKQDAANPKSDSKDAAGDIAADVLVTCAADKRKEAKGAAAPGDDAAKGSKKGKSQKAAKVTEDDDDDDDGEDAFIQVMKKEYLYSQIAAKIKAAGGHEKFCANLAGKNSTKKDDAANKKDDAASTKDGAKDAAAPAPQKPAAFLEEDPMEEDANTETNKDLNKEKGKQKPKEGGAVQQDDANKKQEPKKQDAAKKGDNKEDHKKAHAQFCKIVATLDLAACAKVTARPNDNWFGGKGAKDTAKDAPSKDAPKDAAKDAPKDAASQKAKAA